MSSKGPYTTISLKIDHRDDHYCYFSVPARTRVNLKTGIIEQISMRRETKGEYVKAAIYRSGPNLPFRMKVYPKSYSAARIIYMAYHPEDLNDARPVQFLDGDQCNLKPENLFLGSMGRTKSLHAGTLDEEWIKKVEELIPDPSQRNVRNPVYMKLVNEKKDSNGLTHSQRWYLKRKAERNQGSARPNSHMPLTGVKGRSSSRLSS